MAGGDASSLLSCSSQQRVWRSRCAPLAVGPAALVGLRGMGPLRDGVRGLWPRDGVSRIQVSVHGLQVASGPWMESLALSKKTPACLGRNVRAPMAAASSVPVFPSRGPGWGMCRQAPRGSWAMGSRMQPLPQETAGPSHPRSRAWARRAGTTVLLRSLRTVASPSGPQAARHALGPREGRAAVKPGHVLLSPTLFFKCTKSFT